MKLVLILASFLMFSISATAAENTSVTGLTTSPASHNTLAFNFVGLSQGRTNMYLDIGGLSERVSPALSFRSYSNQEVRKELDNTKGTVDRSLATLGASIAVFQRNNKSILVNPYLYFGTEKDSKATSNVNGPGLRAVGQAYLNKTLALQAGVDANNMEGTFKSEGYVGFAIAL